MTSVNNNPRKFYYPKKKKKQRYDKKKYPKLFNVTTSFLNVDKKGMINHH